MKNFILVFAFLAAFVSLSSAQWVQNIYRYTPIVKTIASETDSALLFTFAVPPNSWADGQAFQIKDLYIASQADSADHANSGAFNIAMQIGDSQIYYKSGATSNCTQPDTCYDWIGFSIRRIGSDVFFALGTTSVPATPDPVIWSSSTNIGSGRRFANGISSEPSYGRLKNFDFTKTEKIKIYVKFKASFAHNYMAVKSATVWKY